MPLFEAAFFVSRDINPSGICDMRCGAWDLYPIAIEEYIAFAK